MRFKGIHPCFWAWLLSFTHWHWAMVKAQNCAWVLVPVEKVNAKEIPPQTVSLHELFEKKVEEWFEAKEAASRLAQKGRKR